jgi:hypothetical protein
LIRIKTDDGQPLACVFGLTKQYRQKLVGVFE